jgi:hypothetical protein
MDLTPLHSEYWLLQAMVAHMQGTSLKIYPEVYLLMGVCGLCRTYFAAYFSFVNATSLNNTAQHTQKHKLRLRKERENCMAAAVPFNYTVVPLIQQFVVLFCLVYLWFDQLIAQHYYHE